MGKKKPKPVLPPLPPLPDVCSPYNLQRYYFDHKDRTYFCQMSNGEYVLWIDDVEVVRTSEPYVDEGFYECAPGEYLMDLRDDEDDEPYQRELFPPEV